MPIIRDAMLADMTVFRRGVMFAVCSIRQATINVPGQLDSLFDEGDNSLLFGNKFASWAWISNDANCANLWVALCRCHMELDKRKSQAYKREVTEIALAQLVDVPGLGIVKAAFVLQLMGFNIACLDARNIAREKRNPRAYRTDGKPARLLAAPIHRYVKETYGKAEFYWDAWCMDVATAYYCTPQQMSDLHLSIVPKNWVPF